MEMTGEYLFAQSPLTADTIAAVATPPGTGGIAVIRLSGPDAITVFKKVWKGASPDCFKSHTAHLGEIIDTSDRTIIDQVVATYFQAPGSFTGENTIEISCHGSHYIQSAVMNALLNAGARTAGPGEFTQRAFLNGRIDLAQAEAIADLIAARARAAHDIAINHTKGGFSHRLSLMRDSLLELASLLELELDFSEEDVTFADRVKLKDLASAILSEVCSLADSYQVGHAITQGIAVAIAGQPNAGKSTLLNKIVGDNRAIVSDIPGTTRDTIEASAVVNGIELRFIDTAGIRNTDEEIERMGISRTIDTVKTADFVIWLIDPTTDLPTQYALLQSHLSEIDSEHIIIAYTKSDLNPKDFSAPEIVSPLLKSGEKHLIFSTSDSPLASETIESHTISATTGEGLPELLHAITSRLTGNLDPRHDLLIANARHYEALQRARTSLERVIEGLDTNLSADFIAQDLRETLAHLGAITGAITSSEILQTVFSRFCIGK